MERISDTQLRSPSCGEEPREIGVESLQFGEEIERLMEAAPQEAGSSFTALLELPPNQAMELLDSPETQKLPPKFHGDVWSNGPQIDHQSAYPLQSLDFPPTFPSNTALLERASRFSVFAAAEKPNSVPSISSPNSLRVKPEPVDSDSNPNSPSPVVPNNKKNSAKRKEREPKGKCSSKKSKSSGNGTDGEQLPYVHVRARRGQATDSHSLAERARREKINARMKLLQDLVPGCNKISGTAMVLDEIINHVQSLQRQVEFLSMRLAAVNPRTDFNLDSLLAAESGSPVDSNFSSMAMPLVWSEGQANGNRQHYQQLWHFNALHQQPVWARQENSHLIGPENTLISYNSSTTSAILHPDQIKMEI